MRLVPQGLRREEAALIDGENHLIVFVAALPEGADADSFKRKAVELAEGFGGYTVPGPHARPPAFAEDGRLKCPRCGNEDPEYFVPLSLRESYREALSLSRDEVRVLDGSEKDGGDAYVYDCVVCHKDACCTDIAWPHRARETLVSSEDVKSE